MLKFYVKVFYVMGKALSGELSCPCDRSCLIKLREGDFKMSKQDIKLIMHLNKIISCANKILSHPNEMYWE